MEEILIVSTKQELISQGYIVSNVGKEFIYNNHTFLLKQVGIRSYPRVVGFGYNPHRAKIVAKPPLWNLTINDLQLEISNIS
jgi:hypothetical protein